MLTELQRLKEISGSYEKKSKRAAARHNNFDALRLLAAFMVLWSHSYPLTGVLPEFFDPVIGKYETLGTFGVVVFFFISGYLVTQSVSRRNFQDYLASRFLRIAPGLAFATLITVFFIGPFLTGMPLRDYFSDPSTFGYLSNILVFPLQGILADTTSNLPFSLSINGSLWTLPIECGFYLWLAFFSGAGLITTRYSILLTLVIGLSCIFLHLVMGYTPAHPGSQLWRGAFAYHIFKFGFVFALGSSFYVYRDWVPHSAHVALICMLILFLAPETWFSQAVFLFAVPYVAYFVAFSRPIAPDLFRKLGDLSYGVYVFAFPVQQLIVHVFHSRISPAGLNAIATPVVLCLSYISWHFIEEPCLELKKRPNRERIHPG